MKITDGSRCPCGTGLTYGDCCARFHRGASAPTTEALMRSRFAAFAVGDAAYLLRTWLPEHRPETISLDIPITFYRLDVLRVSGGGPLADEGAVEFVAYYKPTAAAPASYRPGAQHEHSAFRRLDGEWYYVGEVLPRAAVGSTP